LSAALLVVVALVLSAALVTASPALAKKRPSCGLRIINDWEDGRIDGTYPVACYREALRIVPADLREYSSFTSDVERALQAAVNDTVPAGQIGNPFGAKYARAVADARRLNKLAQSFNHRDEVAIPLGDTSPVSGPICIIAGCGSSASGLPIPLIVLGGVAIVLLIAGTAGMVARKMQERRLPPPDAA